MEKHIPSWEGPESKGDPTGRGLDWHEPTSPVLERIPN